MPDIRPHSTIEPFLAIEAIAASIAATMRGVGPIDAEGRPRYGPPGAFPHATAVARSGAEHILALCDQLAAET